ncbi:hypothetical protein FEM33_00820 [Dyadobacter flavalbus]|uniref:C1q domain-containing protein n=1 Tax=Dyadobacter flavalbus TaxID=2579942 RepID=A0A5M8R6S6_9BACT|nr:hypothetical protein [Dyadobacter flavalbus]KAA6441842.1 hypothetical protein FEM33_00820 [Dyadobacter flavalbus]
MKRLVLLAATFACSHWLHAQNVGINTITPHPSALLDIRQVETIGVDKSAKGILLPTYTLQSYGTPDPYFKNPAKNLIIFHNADNLDGPGLYYNSGGEGNGNDANPFWRKLGDLHLPFSRAGNNSGSLFKIKNSNSANLSGAIHGISTSSGVGVYGESKSGAAIYGESESGTGVYAVSATGNALNVKGKIRLQNNGEGAGKVLTSDANGNASWQAPGNGGGSLPNVAFSVKGVFSNGSQVIDGTGRTVHFHTPQYDLNNNYNAAIEFPQVQPISNFNAPYHGIYHFDAMVAFEDGITPINSLNIYLQVKRSNNTFNESHVTIQLAREDDLADLIIGSAPLAISKDIELWPGDLVSIFCKISPTGSQPTSKLKTGDEDAYFNGRLVIKLD